MRVWHWLGSSVVIGAAVYWHMGNAPSVELVGSRRVASLTASHSLFSSAPPASLQYTAVVAGSTGATGRRLVEELVLSDACSRVIALTRRETNELRSVFPEINEEKAASKLQQVVVDYSTDLAPQLSEAMAQAEQPLVAFCALGSSPGSRLVDVQYAHNFAHAVRDSTAMAVVSSQGARASSMVPYLSTIGEREEDFSKEFNNKPLMIARPGPLDRQELAETRLKERVLGKLDWMIDHLSLIHISEPTRPY
eukprot:TRINITY_DN19786_c0_g1_i2.p1 TRINITY_DN19786_c0_g1~~TRINITY_DN19786_c0_g1_i2.p1  ORF type:complete len:251 (-),score=48.19 TRINITY_DN19786_c0_g1_i2:67-819(-)